MLSLQGQSLNDYSSEVGFVVFQVFDYNELECLVSLFVGCNKYPMKSQYCKTEFNKGFNHMKSMYLL